MRWIDARRCFAIRSPSRSASCAGGRLRGDLGIGVQIAANRASYAHHRPNTRATLEFYIPADDASDRTFQPTHTRIQRFGHIVLGTPHSSEAVAFFRDVLNFRISDSIGENLTFMRPYPNPFHHGIGMVRSGRPVLHHVNFMVTEIDDIGRALHRLRACSFISSTQMGSRLNTASVWRSSSKPTRGSRECSPPHPNRSIAGVPRAIPGWEVSARLKSPRSHDANDWFFPPHNPFCHKLRDAQSGCAASMSGC
jgi:hypothetical protein